MNDQLKLALRQMGYRHMGKEIWGKPIAYHLLVVKMEGKEAIFTNYFHGIKNQLLVWNSHTLNKDDYEQSIKVAEYSTDVSNGFASSKFGFVTPEDRYGDLL